MDYIYFSSFSCGRERKTPPAISPNWPILQSSISSRYKGKHYGGVRVEQDGRDGGGDDICCVLFCLEYGIVMRR